MLRTRKLQLLVCIIAAALSACGQNTDPTKPTATSNPNPLPEPTAQLPAEIGQLAGDALKPPPEPTLIVSATEGYPWSNIRPRSRKLAKQNEHERAHRPISHPKKTGCIALRQFAYDCDNADNTAEHCPRQKSTIA